MSEASEGVTPSERYLGNLCKKSFLTLWSYPNLFRNQGKVKGKGDGKELCDLLVVCGDDIIIFSDKSCAYPNSGKEDVDWGRWFRRSVRDSAKQVFGAERWLKSFPDQIFMDRACTKKLPFTIPTGPNVRYHRIVVALGAKARCQQAHSGGSGNLMVFSPLKGEEAHTQLFTIGQVAPDKGYVHVFDDVTLDIALKYLDTITDFVRYLTAKEKFITSQGVSASGEEDLIAFYLHNADEKGRHYFDVPDPNANIVVNGGYWGQLSSNPKFIAKQIADKPSYLWDAIIEEFTRHLLGGTLRESTTTPADTELILRCMAMETRFARRCYANIFIEARSITGKGQELKRSIASMTLPATAYVFLIADWDGQDLERYRNMRQNDLSQYCLVYAYVNREYKRVIGIATESNSDHGESHDVTYGEFETWTPEMESVAKDVQDIRGWLRPGKLRMSHHIDHEYPQVRVANTVPVGIYGRGKVGRNDPCPCGSGKKFKKCCG